MVRSPLGGSTSYRQLCPLSKVAGNDKDALMNSQLDLSLFCFFCTRPPSEDHVAITAVWGQRHAEGPLRLWVCVLPHQHLLPHSLLSPPPPPYPPNPAVFSLSVLWRSPEPLQGAACFSLIPSHQGRAGSAVFFFFLFFLINETWTVLMRLLRLCVNMCVATPARRPRRRGPRWEAPPGRMSTYWVSLDPPASISILALRCQQPPRSVIECSHLQDVLIKPEH